MQHKGIMGIKHWYEYTNVDQPIRSIPVMPYKKTNKNRPLKIAILEVNLQ